MLDEKAHHFELITPKSLEAFSVRNQPMKAEEYLLV